MFCAALLKTVIFKDTAGLTLTKEEAKRSTLEGPQARPTPGGLPLPRPVTPQGGSGGVA